MALNSHVWLLLALLVCIDCALATPTDVRKKRETGCCQDNDEQYQDGGTHGGCGCQDDNEQNNQGGCCQDEDQGVGHEGGGCCQDDGQGHDDGNGDCCQVNNVGQGPAAGDCCGQHDPKNNPGDDENIEGYGFHNPGPYKIVGWMS